jgi:hypothetical protein
LLRKIETVLGQFGLAMFEPPADNQEPDAPTSGITVYRFPEWFVAQVSMAGPKKQRTRPLVHRRALFAPTKWENPRDRQKYDVVPMRFVQACPNGHITDVDWYAFVHGFGHPCRMDLFVDEWGTSGDISETEIRCECGTSKPLIVAVDRSSNALGWCRGRRPWLGRDNVEPNCRDPKGNPTPNRLLNRAASNAWFPQMLSVISIPDEDEKLKAAVEKVSRGPGRLSVPRTPGHAL